MRWIACRMMNLLMGAFVGTGISIDEEGRLCLPDGLTPHRVHRFVELCTQDRYPHARAAMHDLLRRVGVKPRVVEMLNQVIHEHGDVDLGAVARHGPGLTAALPQLQQIPKRFQAFLVEDLAVADATAATLETAVASARHNAAERFGCAATWDAILEQDEAVAELAAPWRGSLA